MSYQQRLGLWLMIASVQLPLFLLSKSVIGALLSMMLMFFGGILFLAKTKLWKDDQ